MKSRVCSIFVAMAICMTMVLGMGVSYAQGTGVEILNEPFDTIDNAKWSVEGTSGKLEGGMYHIYGGTDLRFASKLESEYTIEYEATLNDCDGWTAIRFAKSQEDATHDSGAEMLFIQPSGAYTLFKAQQSGTIPAFAANTPLKVKIEYLKSTIKVYFNDAKDASATVSNANGYGYVSFYTNGSPTKSAKLDNVKITTYEDSTTQEDVQKIANELSIAKVESGQTKLALPGVPSGYTLDIKSSSDTNVIALDGTITPANQEKTVNVVLTATYTAKNLRADTAPISVVVPAVVKQSDVDAAAAAITAIDAPKEMDTQLKLPRVPEGYEIKVIASGNERLVDLYGAISPQNAQATTEVTFQVTHLNSKMSANTKPVKVVVPPLPKEVTKTVLIDDEFGTENLDSFWTVFGTETQIKNGAFELKNGTFLRSANKIESDYVMEFDVTMKDCSGWVGFLFGGTNPATYTNHWDNEYNLIYIQPNGGFSGIKAGGLSGKYDRMDPNKAVRVKIEFLNSTLNLYMDGALVGSVDNYQDHFGMLSFYHNGGAATSLLDNIKITAYEREIDLQKLADSITSVRPLVYGDRRITMPGVPNRCAIEIENSSDPNVINRAGLVMPKSTNTTVNLTFKVTSDQVQGSALTKPIPVVVPAVAGADNQGMAEFLKKKYGLFVHYVPRLTVNEDGTKIMDGAGSELERLDAFAKAFDVDAFVADVEDMNVDYVIFTAWHANMVALYPSEVMKEHDLENHQVSGRDLIGEIIDALNEKGIDIFLYTHPRDGHDFPAEEAAKVGWVSQPGSANPNFNQFDYDKWNGFVNDVYAELIDKYGSKISGLFVDEGSAEADSYRVVDYQRLRETIKSRNNDLVLMHNYYGTEYTMDLGMKEYFYWCEFNPAMGGANGTNWPVYEIPVGAGIAKSGWWAGAPKGQTVTDYSAQDLYRYTILQASANTKGGGVAWAAGPYTNGDGWEKDIKENLVKVGNYIEPIEESIKNTYPSTSFLTRSGSTLGTITFGATQSTDGKKEYIHVLNAPGTGNSINLGVPQDNKQFAPSATALLDGTKVVVSQDPVTKAVMLTLQGKTWNELNAQEKLNYPIALEVKTVGPAEETFSYIDNTNKAIRYVGSWSYQRWERNRSYQPDWATTVGADYESDIHTSSSEGASFEVPFVGTGIAYMPNQANTNTQNCDVYLDGKLVKSGVSLYSQTYKPQVPVYEVKGLSNGPHTLKVVNRGVGVLSADVFKVYQTQQQAANKEALQALYAANKDRAKVDYTAASWNAFAAVLTAAKKVLDDTNATQRQVDDAKAALEQAVAALVKTESAIVDEIKNATDGATVKVPASGNGTIPNQALEAARGRNVNLVIQYGNYTWTINGKDITGKLTEGGYDLHINDAADAKLKKLAQGKSILELDIAHDGTLPFKATLRINVGSAYNGKTLHLYYYNEAGNRLVYQSAGVAKDGIVTFDFTRCSKYVVTTEVLKTEETPSATPSPVPGGTAGTGTTGQGDGNTPKTGDTADAGAWLILCIVAGAAALGAATYMLRKKRA